MSFWSRLKLKNDKDPAWSQSGVVVSAQNEETSSKTGTKVCCFLPWVFDYSDDCLRRFSQSRRTVLHLFRFGNTRRRNHYVVALSAAHTITFTKALVAQTAETCPAKHQIRRKTRRILNVPRSMSRE